METAPLSILVLDSDPRSLNFFATYLSKRGFAVTLSTSIKEGYITALRDHPDVVIFDANNGDMPALEFIKRLRNDRRTASTIQIALSSKVNDTELGSFLAAGCNEYLAKAPETIAKLMEIFAAHQGIPTQNTSPRQGGLLIVFLSAKGGTGTSSLCANLAHVAARTHPNLDVCVMDMVLPLGSIASTVGYDGEFGLVQASAEAPEAVDGDYLRRHISPLENWGFRLVAGASNPETANSVDATRIPTLIRAARQAFDVTFVDLGRSLSRISLPIILEADVVAIIIATDLATVSLSKTVWDYLQAKELDTQRAYPILNRAVGLEGLSKSDAERILGLQIQSTIPYMMGNFTLANNQHLPVTQRFPNDTAAMMLEQISNQLLEIAHQGRK
jgi:Flp pilus assembly CpaE family ATPase